MTKKPGKRGKDTLMDARKIVGIIVLILAAIYIISPIDFIPDVIVGIGWVDDFLVLLMALAIANQTMGK
jgi:uncharacterized membrane protein YkvA (DUF1232 family)